MKLFEVKEALSKVNRIAFQLENGDLVPSHFHVTEVGKVTKHFIDCGGTIRNEEVVNFQLWSANDYDHRLHPEKLGKIISLSERELKISDDLNIEVEYQGGTIGKFGLEFDGTNFQLTNKKTDCLAKDNCGIPSEKPKMKLSELQNNSTCKPGGNCC